MSSGTSANLALAEELFADNVIRHEVGEAHTLTHEQAVKRVEDTWAMFDTLRFDLNIVIAGTTVSTSRSSTTRPYRPHSDTATIPIGSIEVFRVVDGRITEVWNCGYQQGVWN